MDKYIRSETFRAVNQTVVDICADLKSFNVWMDLLDPKTRYDELVHKINNYEHTAKSNLNQHEIEKNK